MELKAVINAINYFNQLNLNNLEFHVYSDSQYVVNLMDRQAKLTSKHFITKKGKLIQNYDLVKILLEQIEKFEIKFIKVEAHKKNGNIFNKEVDLLVRKLVREKVSEYERNKI